MDAAWIGTHGDRPADDGQVLLDLSYPQFVEGCKEEAVPGSILVTWTMILSSGIRTSPYIFSPRFPLRIRFPG